MDEQRQQFDRFIDAISPALEHADRVGAFGAYCMGVLLEGERKSFEPMAARLNPTNLRQAHQSLHHFISTSAWSDQAVLTCGRTRDFRVTRAGSDPGMDRR